MGSDGGGQGACRCPTQGGPAGEPWFEIASAQYREGLGSQLELTDSEVALRESEFNYAQAAYDFLVAQANLDLAVGSVPMVDSGPLAGRLQ